MSEALAEPVSFKIKAESPFNFETYGSVFSLENYRLPFEYGHSQWRTVVETDKGKLIPVEVSPDSRRKTKFLEVKIFGDVSSDERRMVDRTIKAVFCTKVALQRNNNVFRNGFGAVFQKFSGLKPHLSQDPYHSMVKIIIRQQIGAEYAKRVITNLTQRFGRRLTLDGVEFFAFPTPKRLSQATKGQLLACGTGYKWRYIRELSKGVIDGDVDFDRLRTLKNDEVISELEDRIGIGLWSSRVFLFDGLHRLNAYPIFDITVQRALVSLRESEGIPEEDFANGWGSFGPEDFIGFYATYLFAYFRQMVKV